MSSSDRRWGIGDVWLAVCGGFRFAIACVVIVRLWAAGCDEEDVGSQAREMEYPWE